MSRPSPSIEVDHLSHSSLALYRDCGRKWRFHYVERLPEPGADALIYGKAIHYALAMFFTARFAYAVSLEEAKAQLLTWYDESVEESLAELDDTQKLGLKKTPGDWRSSAEDLLGSESLTTTIASLVPLVDKDGLAVEREFSYQIKGVGVPVVGFVDLVTDDGTIVDFKTASRKWPKTRHETEVQHHYYYAGLKAAGVPVSGEFLHIVLPSTGGTQTFKHSFNQEKYEWLEQVARETWAGIDAGIFPKNPKHCWAYGQRCAFWQQCHGGR